MRDWKAFWEELGWEAGQNQEDAVVQRLKQRAEQYAKEPSQDDSAEKYNVLTFALGQERYAVDVMLVKMVRHIDRITPVPGTPEFYPGVVNLRGQIITVMDLRRFFHMTVDDVPHELVVIQSNQLEIGLLAHHIEGVMDVPVQDVQPIDDIRYARGVTAEQLILLDVARLFEDDRLIIGGVYE